MCWGTACSCGTQLAFTLASPVTYGHARLVSEILRNSFLLHVGGVCFLWQKAGASLHCETKLNFLSGKPAPRIPVLAPGTHLPSAVGVRLVQGPSAPLPAAATGAHGHLQGFCPTGHPSLARICALAKVRQEKHVEQTFPFPNASKPAC